MFPPPRDETTSPVNIVLSFSFADLRSFSFSFAFPPARHFSALEHLSFQRRFCRVLLFSYLFHCFLAPSLRGCFPQFASGNPKPSVNCRFCPPPFKARHLVTFALPSSSFLFRYFLFLVVAPSLLLECLTLPPPPPHQRGGPPSKFPFASFGCPFSWLL